MRTSDPGAARRCVVACVEPCLRLDPELLKRPRAEAISHRRDEQATVVEVGLRRDRELHREFGDGETAEDHLRWERFARREQQEREQLLDHRALPRLGRRRERRVVNEQLIEGHAGTEAVLRQVGHDLAVLRLGTDARERHEDREEVDVTTRTHARTRTDALERLVKHREHVE